MIPVTRLDGTAMVVNDEQIAAIEQTPDTVISFVSGDKLVVREGPDTLVQRVVEFKRTILAGLRVAPPMAAAGPHADAREAL